MYARITEVLESSYNYVTQITGEIRAATNDQSCIILLLTL